MRTLRISFPRPRVTDNCLPCESGLEPQDLLPRPKEPAQVLELNAQGVEGSRLYSDIMETMAPDECPRCQTDLDKTGACECGYIKPSEAVIHGITIRDGLEPDPDLEDDRSGTLDL